MEISPSNVQSTQESKTLLEILIMILNIHIDKEKKLAAAESLSMKDLTIESTE